MTMQQSALKIDGDFPGGNIAVESVTGDVVRVHQEMRDTEGWWFYWAFRVTGAQGRKLQFIFTDGEPIGVRGPAVSADEGANWHWLGTENGDNRSFTYHFAKDAREVRFSMGIPYLQSDWDTFLRQHQKNANARPGVLCTSRQRRSVECLFVGPTDRKPLHRVLLTSRHHCCEAMATYALEGLLETALSAATDEGRWLAEYVEFLAIPFVDKDGTENGDQGKSRLPRDHGRDYDGESIFQETAAIRKLIPRWSDGLLAAVLDLHCPWIRGKLNEDIYQVGSLNERVWNEQQRFGAILESICRGALPYHAADDLPFGDGSWNCAENYTKGKGLCSWAADQLNVPLITSFELPYANAGGVEVIPAAARAFGNDIASALCVYLKAM